MDRLFKGFLLSIGIVVTGVLVISLINIVKGTVEENIKTQAEGVALSSNVIAKELCINGVMYYVFSAYERGFMAVKFNPDSTVVTCGE